MLSGSGGIGGGGGVQWSKPAALVCHICGREYGTASLKIHLPQCEKMWIEREKLKDKKDRRPVPKPPSPAMANGGKLNIKDGNAMAAYNEAAMNAFNEKALVPCPNCARTFFEDRLAIHLRSCRPGNEAARVGTGRITSAAEATVAATPMKAPRVSGGMAGGSSSTVTSPVGSSSKPRGSAAPPTSRPVASSSKSATSASASKSAPASNWEDELNDDDGGFSNVPSKNYSIPSDAFQGDEGDTAPCSLCGRHFNVDRLAKHESVCRKQQASEAKRQKLIAKKQAKLPQPGSQHSDKTDAWKSKHNEFQSAIQYAKKCAAMQKAGKSLANLPPPPRSENPDYITCPHCDRRFNQQAGERHIKSCATTINKPKPVNKIAKPPAPGSMAAQRAKQASSLSPTALRQQTGGYGGGGYDDYSPQYQSPPPPSHQRPGSSGGLQPRSSAASSSSRTSTRPTPTSSSSSSSTRPGAQRSPQAGGGRLGVDANLYNQINQLTATVEKLSKVVLSPNSTRGGGGIKCRSCGELNPVAAAKFCPSCGARH